MHFVLKRLEGCFTGRSGRRAFLELDSFLKRHLTLTFRVPAAKVWLISMLGDVLGGGQFHVLLPRHLVLQLSSEGFCPKPLR